MKDFYKKHTKLVFIIAGIFLLLIILAVITSPGKKQNNSQVSNAPLPTIKVNTTNQINEVAFDIVPSSIKLPSELTSYTVNKTSGDSIKKIANKINLNKETKTDGLDLVTYADDGGNYLSYQSSTGNVFLVNKTHNEWNNFTEQNTLSRLNTILDYNFDNYVSSTVTKPFSGEGKYITFGLNIKSYSLLRDFNQNFILGVYITKDGVLDKLEWKFVEFNEGTKYPARTVENLLQNFNSLPRGIYPNLKESDDTQIEKLTLNQTFIGKITANSISVQYLWSENDNNILPVYVLDCDFINTSNETSKGKVLLPAI